MKKILFFILIVISIQSFAQPAGYQKRIVNERIQGSFMVDSAFNIPRYYDTTAANLHKRSDSCGAMFFSYAKDSIYIRLCNPKKWITLGSGGSTPGWNAVLAVNSHSPTITDEVNIAMGGNGFSILGASFYTFNTTNGEINIDSLRNATTGAYTLTWDAGGSVRKMPSVKYDFTGLANWDKLRYNSGLGAWVNFTPTYTSDTTNLRTLVKNISTGVEYYTDLPTGDDTTRIIQVLDTLTDLDDAVGNVAIIDGRLWVLDDASGNWRRQAYDTTYTPAAPPSGVYITDSFGGGDDADINGRTTETGGGTWVAAGSNTGTVGTVSAYAKLTSAGGTIAKVTVDGTVRDLKTTVTAVYILMAYQDDNNYIQTHIEDGSTYQIVSGSPTLLVASSGTTSNGDSVAVRLSGSNLTVYRNGVSIGTTSSVSGSLTGTKQGLLFYTITTCEVAYIKTESL